jgi:hypothetical protein
MVLIINNFGINLTSIHKRHFLAHGGVLARFQSLK